MLTTSQHARDATPPTAAKGNLRKWLRTRWPAPSKTEGSEPQHATSPHTVGGLLFGHRKSGSRRGSKSLASGAASTGMLVPHIPPLCQPYKSLVDNSLPMTTCTPHKCSSVSACVCFAFNGSHSMRRCHWARLATLTPQSPYTRPPFKNSCIHTDLYVLHHTFSNKEQFFFQRPPN